MFAGSTAPEGYLMCDGSAISRTTYSALFAVIGTTYGAGDGSTTFNLPGSKGKVPVGYNSSETEFNALGKTGGEKTHTLTIAEMPSHSHSKTVIPRDTQWVAPTGGWNYSYTDGATYTQYTDDTGGGGAHNNLQPYFVINYIIKT
jgi:microcystin-dependent protein